MTSATEVLRRMLDERGVEWTANDGEYVKETCWTYMGELTAAFAEYNDGTTRFDCDTWYFTPEQAIAATLGRTDCHVKAIKKMGDMYGIKLSCGHSMVNPFNDIPGFCPWCGRKVVDE